MNPQVLKLLSSRFTGYLRLNWRFLMKIKNETVLIAKGDFANSTTAMHIREDIYNAIHKSV